MAITQISRDDAANVSLVRVDASNTMAEVLTSGYVTTQEENIKRLNSGTWVWQTTDAVLISCSDGHLMCEFDNGDFSTFQQMAEGNGNVTLPVVNGNFSVFDGTAGSMQDLGYSPTNAAKTKVIMANAAVLANHIACFTDTAGTVDDDSATAINAGNLQAGLSGTAGYLASFPATSARGSLRLVAANNAGDTVTQITNASFAQASVLTIPDPGATGNFCLRPAALVNGNLVRASGVAGLLADSGYAIKAVNGAVALGGSATQSFSDAFVTALSVVIGFWATSANAVNIQKIVPGVSSFDVISSGDAGAGTFNYVVINITP